MKKTGMNVNKNYCVWVIVILLQVIYCLFFSFSHFIWVYIAIVIRKSSFF